MIPSAILLAFVVLRHHAPLARAAGAPTLACAALLLALAGAIFVLARAARGRPLGEKVLLGLLACAGFVVLVKSLAPPVEWDALAYHLALPRLYARAGGLVEIPWLLHSHWPHLAELAYALPLSLGFERLPAVLHAGACAAWIALVARAGERALGRGPALLAAALVAAQPVVLSLAGTAHSDGWWSLFHLCAALSLLDGRRERAAVFAGLAVSCKLLGLLALPGWAFWLWRQKDGGPKAAARFCALSLAVSAPWFLKSWAWAGNPVWPFFAGVLGGDFGAAGFVKAYEASNRLPWPPPAWLFLRNGLPFIVLPAVLALLARPRGARVPEPVKLLWLAAPVHLALTLSHQEAARFFMPFYPAAALLAAWAAAEAWRAGGRGRRALAGAAVVLGLSPLAGARASNELFGALSLRSAARPELSPREAYLSRATDHYEAYARFDGLLEGRRAKVLLFREIRGFYLRASYMWGDPLNQGLIDYARLEDGRALERRLRELGVTHVLVNEATAMYRPGGPVYDLRTGALMDDVLSRARPLDRLGGLSLYELSAF